MAVCDDVIKRDIELNCKNPVVGGIESNGVIINRNDIDLDAITYNATRTNVVENLPLKTGKRGYKIYVPGANPFTGTTAAMEKGTNRNSFTNDVGFVILDNDPDVCAEIIDGLANGTFVVVYENKFKNVSKTTTPGDSTFQVAGLLQGLKAETLENNKYSEDTEGGWAILLKETKSPMSAIFLYKASISATRTLFDSLTEAVA